MDYGLTANNAIIPVNTVSQSTRAFTGHEQISELSGLIHMNARVYDSDIGRFLSADPVLQAPLDSQSYNRYSYVRNNPLKFTDPTGNSWWTRLRNKITKPFKKAWKWVKKNSRFVLATIGAIVTGGFLAPLVLGAGGLGLSGIALAAASGAAAGAVSGAISTGTWKGALKGALIGGLTAGAAYGVAELTSSVMGIDSATAHSASFLKNGLTKVTAFKTLGHGLARGLISRFQGGSFKAGFLSGLSSGFDVGTTGYGGIIGRTAIMAIAGGTASVLGGGKFSNGAFGGAMTHLFNAEWRISISASAGAGTGGTIEKGITVSHNDKTPWYTGWKIGDFSTEGVGGYAGADFGMEVNIGNSQNNDIEALNGVSVTSGGSADILGFLNLGTEVSVSNTAAPLHNISIGAYGNPFIPGEAHVFATNIQVNVWGSW